MNLSRVRSMFEEAGRRRRQGWGGSWGGSDNASNQSTPSVSTQQSDDDLQQEALKAAAGLSDQELLDRARAAHNREDFASLAAGPEANGPWKRVEGVDRFVVFRRPIVGNDNHDQLNGLEVMCAGRLDASIEEVASILRSRSEIEHNASMTALFAKSFIFGSYEREVSCSRTPDNQDDNIVDDGSGEQLAVKTKSFARTTMLGRNEQWCYVDYFQRKKERDGFTISKRALPPNESTPGRILGQNAHVDQLHGLNASYLVDKLPDRKGLRVVFHAWFDSPDAGKSRGVSRSTSIPGPGLRSKSFDYGEMNTHKAQMRRLLAMAHGVMNLPDLIRRRRFGVQIPADLGAVHALNSRCPCCTHSLSVMKSTLAKAAFALTSRSFAPLKMDTRRCFLCGYLVCVDCWSTEHMESVAGRVAAIVVCVRCQANVQACEYAEVFAGTAAEREKHRGPPRVVENSNNTSTVSLLIDFLTASLQNAAAGSPEHAAVMAVIRTLLHQNEQDSDEDSEDEALDNNEYERNVPRFEVLDETEAVKKVGEMLSDDRQFATLEACKLGNSQQRSYLLDLPEDPTVDVPRSPIPSNEAERIATIKSAGLLELANLFAPETPPTDVSEPRGDLVDVHDLELLCHLAVKTLDCAYSFVTVMCAKHEHVMFGTHPAFVGAAVPREQTSCQHALMSPYPFMATHQEADVRFHKQGAISAIPIRFYLGFPLTIGGNGEEVTVGMLCCIDSKPRAEITRAQYATMTRLASTATHFLVQKGRQLEQQQHLNCKRH